jgi:hypothetical protein
MSMLLPRRPRRGRSLPAVAVGLMVGLALMSGCSKSSSTNVTGEKLVASAKAHDLLIQAKAAVEGARSVRVKGTITAGGSIMTVNLGIGASTAVGTVDVNGSPAEARILNGRLYLMGDTVFWDALKQGVGAGFGGSWVQVSAHTGPQFGALLDLVPPPTALDKLAPTNSSWAQVPGRKVNGSDTLGVRDIQVGHGNTLYISKDKPGSPVGIAQASGGFLTFSSWGKPVETPVSPGEDVLDASEATLAEAVLPSN